MSYDYTVNLDGTVTYIGPDKKVQIIADRDVSSKEALESQLDEYTRSYVAGLDTQKVSIGKDIAIGTKLNVTAREE